MVKWPPNCPAPLRGSPYWSTRGWARRSTRSDVASTSRGQVSVSTRRAWRSKGVELFDQGLGGLDAPRVGEEFAESFGVDGGEADQDRGVAVVVVLGQELVRVRDEEFLLGSVAGDA